MHANAARSNIITYPPPHIFNSRHPQGSAPAIRPLEPQQQHCCLRQWDLAEERSRGWDHRRQGPESSKTSFIHASRLPHKSWTALTSPESNEGRSDMAEFSSF